MQSCHQEGVLADKSGLLPSSGAGLSRYAVTNANKREQACLPCCHSSSSVVYPGNAIRGLGSGCAQRNVPGSVPGHRLQLAPTLLNADPAQLSQTPSA